MKRGNKTIILISNIISVICFIVIGIFFYLRGNTSFALIFAVLTLLQIAFTVVNLKISRK